MVIVSKFHLPEMAVHFVMALAAGCMNLRLYGAVKFKYDTFLSCGSEIEGE
jgi:hypothetical protein